MARSHSFIRKNSKLLSQNETTIIKTKYQTQKKQLESQRTNLQQLLSNEVNAVKVKAAEQMKLVDAEQAMAQNKSKKELQLTEKQYKTHYETITRSHAEASKEAAYQCQKRAEEIDQLRKKISGKHWHLGKIQRDLAAYKNISLKAYISIVLNL